MTILLLTRNVECQSLNGCPGSLTRPCIGTHSERDIGQGDRQIDCELSAQSSIDDNLKEKNRSVIIKKNGHFLYAFVNLATLLTVNVFLTC